jgi:hypothetical protein
MIAVRNGYDTVQYSFLFIRVNVDKTRSMHASLKNSLRICHVSMPCVVKPRPKLGNWALTRIRED